MYYHWIYAGIEALIEVKHEDFKDIEDLEDLETANDPPTSRFLALLIRLFL